ncbi:hypothetical protein GGX14DRAFT_645964 [Mycena pura]|uniref:Uncharacterized protein n=1 Tax=Mycena pura TaxID=153505 RepID=A0AAD6Y6V7_9AGAR|nr:hypothetical protein GGX14DRAFT_645964 [Mycena pura]
MYGVISTSVATSPAQYVRLAPSLGRCTRMRTDTGAAASRRARTQNPAYVHKRKPSRRSSYFTNIQLLASFKAASNALLHSSGDTSGLPLLFHTPAIQQVLALSFRLESRLENTNRRTLQSTLGASRGRREVASRPLEGVLLRWHPPRTRKLHRDELDENGVYVPIQQGASEISNLLPKARGVMDETLTTFIVLLVPPKRFWRAVKVASQEIQLPSTGIKSDRRRRTARVVVGARRGVGIDGDLANEPLSEGDRQPRSACVKSVKGVNIARLVCLVVHHSFDAGQDGPIQRRGGSGPFLRTRNWYGRCEGFSKLIRAEQLPSGTLECSRTALAGVAYDGHLPLAVRDRQLQLALRQPGLAVPLPLRAHMEPEDFLETIHVSDEEQYKPFSWLYTRGGMSNVEECACHKIFGVEVFSFTRMLVVDTVCTVWKEGPKIPNGPDTKAASVEIWLRRHERRQKQRLADHPSGVWIAGWSYDSEDGKQNPCESRMRSSITHTAKTGLAVGFVRVAFKSRLRIKVQNLPVDEGDTASWFLLTTKASNS